MKWNYIDKRGNEYPQEFENIGEFIGQVKAMSGKPCLTFHQAEDVVLILSKKSFRSTIWSVTGWINRKTMTEMGLWK